jgi:hypothetical protein
MGLAFIKKTYGISVNFGFSIRILLSSGIASGLTFFVVSEVAFAAWIRLLLGAVLFIAILVPALLFSRAVTKADIANIQLIVGGLGVLGGLISKLLALLKRVMVFLKL